MSKKIVFRIIAGVAIFIIISLLIQGSYRLYCRVEKDNNHKEITDFIDNELTFEPEKLDEEIEIINEWIASSYITELDKGHLYERLSNIYKFQGNQNASYEAMGRAAYYLEVGGDYEYTINLYLDMVTFFIMNVSVDNANKTMQEVYAIASLDDIESLQIRSYAYRMQGILQRENGEYEEALKSFEESLRILEDSNTNTYEAPYIAITDVNRAMTYVKMGQLEEAAEILEAYEGSSYFERTVYVDIMARDFIIPYYETATYLYASLSEDEKIKESLDNVAAYCEEFGYQKVELNALLNVAQIRSPEESDLKDGFYELLNRTYRAVLIQQSDEYADIIAGAIADERDDTRDREALENAQWKRVQTYVMYAVFVALLIIVICVIVHTSKRDALTSVFRRREFNRTLRTLRSFNHEYAVMMLDIDNFKRINDTYGHQKGDEVLATLGGILSSKADRYHVAYRYGGEEFAMIFTKDLNNCKIVAESIRHYFESIDWSFCEESITVSIGVAIGKGSEDVVKAADDNLYKAKENGKNQVVF